MNMANKSIPVKVALRCRPLVPKEEQEGCTSCVEFVPGEPQVILGSNKTFTYDFVFPPNSTQEDLYATSVASLVENIFKGYNATVLAYGQTGSGKTHTMGGAYDLGVESGNNEIMGVIPRVVNDLYRGIDNECNYSFTVKVSYIELYKEDIFDLLVPDGKREKDSISIREGVNGEILVQGMREQEAGSPGDALSWLEKGAAGRTTGSTAMNTTSSRSHAIFTLHISKVNKEDSNDYCQMKFHLVDLAGSERQKKTKAEGERFKEGVNINKGLLCLGNVISALGEDNKVRGHIPYRDSKLTRLLQDSLGGNSFTLMVACASPADSNMEETLSTLRYADRARKIKNKPVVNRDPQAAEIMRLRNIIQAMKEQGYDHKSSVKQTPDGDSKLKIQTLTDKIVKLQDEVNSLTNELKVSLDQNIAMHERIILADASKEQLSQEIENLNAQLKLRMDKMNATFNVKDDSNASIKEHLDDLECFQKSVQDLVVSSRLDATFEVNESAESQLSQESNEELDEAEKNFVLKRARMGRELQELDGILRKKEQLARQMAQSDKVSMEINDIEQKHEEERKKLEEERDQLLLEKEELSEQLYQMQKNPKAGKIAEQRRKRLQELEPKLLELKRKLTEQAKGLKLKEQREKDCQRLGNEIKSMKQQRVKLMKQLKEEAENFRRWKNQKDKELMQLKAKDRKRQVEITRLQQEHAREQNVLKRKAEKFAAINKRLMQNLDRQKNAQKQRLESKEKEKMPLKNRLKEKINDELEIVLSREEARRHLDELMADRKVLSSKIVQQKMKLGAPAKKKQRLTFNAGVDTTEDKEKMKIKIQGMQNDMEIMTAEISNLQTKLLDSEQDDKKNQRWQMLHTLVDSKLALSHLFKLVVDARLECTQKEAELEDLQMNLQAVQQSSEEKKDAINQVKNELEDAKKAYEDRIFHLLQDLQKSKQSDDKENVISDKKVLQDITDTASVCVKKEIKEEVIDADGLPCSRFFTPPNKPGRRSFKRKSKPMFDPLEEDYILDESIEFSDDDTDADWIAGKTPR